MKKIILAMLYLIALVVALGAEKWIFELKTIIVPVGESEEELYIYDAPDHLEDAPDHGPTKFTVDEEDNLYIVNLNKKEEFQIKKYEKNGNYLSSIKVNDSIFDITYNNKNIYLLNMFRHKNNKDQTYYLLVFSDELVLIDSFKLQNKIIPIGYKLLSNNLGELGIMGSAFQKIRFENNMAIILENTELFDNITMKYDQRNQKHTITMKNTNREINLFENWEVEHYQFMNIAYNNNIYFKLWNGKSTPQIGIITDEGEFVDTNIEIEDYTSYGLKFIFGPENVLRKDGSVYQLIPMKDRVEIRKWYKIEEEK